MDHDLLRTGIIAAETELLTTLRVGDLMGAVDMHLEVPDYRHVWNGEVKTHEMLRTRVRMRMEKGLASLDNRVSGREFKFISDDFVLELLMVTETATMKDGTSSTAGPTAVSILWQRVDGQWRLGHVHGSTLPEEP